MKTKTKELIDTILSLVFIVAVMLLMTVDLSGFGI